MANHSLRRAYATSATNAGVDEDTVGKLLNHGGRSLAFSVLPAEWCILMMMGRNALDAFGQQITERPITDVAQTEHPDHPLALVDHRQPADLQRLHVPDRLGEVIVLSAAMDAWGHHITGRRA